MLTGLQIINEIEDRLGWKRTKSLEESFPTKDTRKLQSLLNRVLKTVQTLDDWPLLRGEGDILLVPTLQSQENLTFTNGSTTVTNRTEDEAWDASMTNMAFQISSYDTVYRIVSVDSSATLTLDRPWVHDTAVDEDAVADAGQEVTYYIAQDTYAMPEDFDRITGDMHSYLTSGDIKSISPRRLAKRRARRNNRILVANPDRCTVYGMNDAQQYQLLHVDPWPEDQQVITYTYQRVHPEIATDIDKILFPAAQESIVIEAVIYLAERDYEDSVQMDTVLRDYMTAVSQGVSASGATEDVPILRPENVHRKLHRRKYGHSARVDSNIIFDTTGRAIR